MRTLLCVSICPCVEWVCLLQFPSKILAFDVQPFMWRLYMWCPFWVISFVCLVFLFLVGLWAAQSCDLASFTVFGKSSVSMSSRVSSAPFFFSSPSVIQAAHCFNVCDALFCSLFLFFSFCLVSLHWLRPYMCPCHLVTFAIVSQPNSSSRCLLTASFFF